MFHFRDDESFSRMHLRKEKNGTGILVVNATRIFHLNQTAVEFVSRILEGKDDDQIVKEIGNKFRADEAVLREDLTGIKNSIIDIVKQPDVDPVQRLSQDISSLDEVKFSAPLRMDLALTYDCNNRCSKCYVEGEERVGMTPLSTAQWKQVLDTLWDEGIPHVVFTGGEPTLFDDLPQLVEYAEDLGIITGINSNGRRLKDKQLVEELVVAGIDHFQITIESHDPKIHDKMVGVKGAWEETVQGIKNIAPTPVFFMTNTTLTPYNIAEIEKTVDFLASIGVEKMAANGIIYAGGGKKPDLSLSLDEMDKTLTRLMNQIEKKKMEFLWYTPTKYCEFNPIEKGLGMKKCTAAHIAMAIEPDGQVIPCQSYFEPLGNILETKWKKIWNHKTAKYLRSNAYLNEECQNCPERELCGGGCPLNYTQSEHVCTNSFS